VAGPELLLVVAVVGAVAVVELVPLFSVVQLLVGIAVPVQVQKDY